MAKRLFLSIFSFLIVVFSFYVLYTNIYNNADKYASYDVPSAYNACLTFIFCSIFLFILTITTTITIGKKFPRSDIFIFPLIILLNGIGLMQINRIDYSEVRIWDDYSFAVYSQFLFTIVGIVIFLLINIFIKHDRILRKFIWTSMFLGMILLILPLIPGLGVETNGANVWVKIGPLGTIQPAEFAKTFFIVFFAGYLTINRERLTNAGERILGFQFPRLRDFGPILVIWGVSLFVLVFQHDLGTSLLFFALFIALLYTSTGKLSWTIVGIALFTFGAVLCFQIFPHVAARVDAWLNPFDENVYFRSYNGSGQIVQGFFALASGGLFGKGAAGGYPSLTPFSNSDFIYTSIGEEYGLTGLMAILLLYLFLAQRSISISLRINDKFGKLTAIGIGFSLCIQIFVVIGGVTGIIPVTGLTLPFIAKGGSSLIANYIMFGVLQLISNRNSTKISNAQTNDLTNLSSYERIINAEKKPIIKSHSTLAKGFVFG